MKASRTKRRYLSLSICVVAWQFVAGNVCGDSTPPFDVAAVAARISSVTAVTADFRQAKNMEILPQAILSTGTFFYLRDTGVFWEVKSPAPVTYVVWDRSKKNDQVFSCGGPASGPEDNNWARRIFQIVYDLSSGNWKNIEKRFAATAAGTAKAWTLTLTPSDSSVKRGLRSITLDGDDYVQNVHIDLTGRDSMAIEFLNQREPSAKEIEWRVRCDGNR